MAVIIYSGGRLVGVNAEARLLLLDLGKCRSTMIMSDNKPIVPEFICSDKFEDVSR